MAQPRTVLLITNIPTPYRVPLLNELATQLQDRSFELKVIFGARGYPRRKWDVDLSECRFPFSVLPQPNFFFSGFGKIRFTYTGLSEVLRKEVPSAIITNGFSLATTKLWWRSLFTSTPYIIWSGAVKRPFVRESKLRRSHRKLLIRRAAAFVVYGKKAKEYVVALGADVNKVFIGINTVDTEYFRREAERRRSHRSTSQKKKHLLYVGNLAPQKRIDLLLKAMALVYESRKDCVVELVGFGSDESRLRSLAEEVGIASIVQFEGFKQKTEVPDYLARADCFLFPSEYDIWGLVLVEAMSAKVCCISSIHAGATMDLIRDGETGFAVDFSDTRLVAERILWVLDHQVEAQAIGLKGQQFIDQEVNLKISARGFVAAIESLSSHQPTAS